MNETHLERAIRELTVKRLMALGLVAFASGLVLMWVSGIILLKQSQDTAEAAIRALTEDDLPRALDLIVEARADAVQAERIMSDPLLSIITKPLPFVDHERESLEITGKAAASLTAAAETFLTSLSSLVGNQKLGEGLYSNGAIEIGLVSEIVPLADDLLSETDEAMATLRTTEPTRFSFVDARIRRTIVDLTVKRQALSRVRNLAAAAPGLLGGQGSKVYLLALQSPSEARGGGGLVGVVGLLELDAGAISLEKIDSIRTLLPPLERPVVAPGWFEGVYGPLGATRDPRLSNLSPDFPTTAEVLASIYRRRTGTRVDGVISMDPLVLGNLSRATGPIEADGWRVKITPNSARELLLEDVYEHFQGREGHQNGYFKNLVDVVMNRIADGSVEESALVKALADSVSEQRLKLYSVDDGTQSLLRKAGLSGDPDASADDVQMIFNNNFSANKIDFYLKRTIDVEIEIISPYEARVETTVTLHNDVPENAPVNVLIKPGLNRDLSLGTNQMTLHALVPAAATDTVVLEDGEISPHRFSVDDNQRMIWGEVMLERGESKTMTYGYTLGLAQALDLTLIPQAAVRPDRYSLSIHSVGGFCLIGPAGDGRSRIRDGGFLRGPKSIDFEIVKAAC